MSILKAKKSIYVYGNGIRGQLIKRYLEVVGVQMTGIVVSEEFYDDSEDAQSILNIDITLSKNIYNFMSEYVNL